MKKFILTVLLVSCSIFASGYATEDMAVSVTASVDELPLEGIEVSYQGNTKIGEKLNKNDFVVIPFFTWVKEDQTTLLQGISLENDDFSIEPDVLTDEKEIIRVFYQNKYKDIEVCASEKGRITIKTDGLKASVTIDAIKQVVDDKLLNDGKDITYTIQSQNMTEPVSETMTQIIEQQKEIKENLEVLKAYDINIKKDVDGEISTLINKTNSDICITLVIPSEFVKRGKEYWMIHEHEGIVELLKDLDDKVETITIKTSSFSNYILYSTDSNGNIVSAPTMDTGNDMEFEFDGNNDEIYQIPNHIHDHIEVITKATCESAEYREIRCKICSSYEKKNIVEPLGHEWRDSEDKTGYEICIRCGKERKTDVENYFNEPSKKEIIPDESHENEDVYDKESDKNESFTEPPYDNSEDKTPSDFIVIDDGEEKQINDNGEIVYKGEKPKSTIFERGYTGWICFIFPIVLIIAALVVWVLSKRTRKE